MSAPYIDLSNGDKIILPEYDWDYLIILDACRYDYFKKVYDKYLRKRLARSKLRKMLSPASMTTEWARKVWTGKYDDIVYVSGNPWINSKVPIGGFYAKKHFYRIIDAWDKGWDNELATVPAERLNIYAIISSKIYRNKRLVIHYMQPHAPYLVLYKVLYKLRLYDNNYMIGAIPVEETKRRVHVKSINRSLYWWRFNLTEKYFHNKLALKILNKIGKITYRYSYTEAAPVSILAARFGISVIRKAYLYNLLYVIKNVLKILNKFKGKIIITADHGELLGDYYLFDHTGGSRLPQLRTVPWVEIINK